MADSYVINDLAMLVSAGRRYGTIYADPPWRYNNQATRASTERHYQAVSDINGLQIQPASGMTVEQICALPIPHLAADDAHLHLWTTNAFLFECPRVFDSWGFEFRSSFVWVKDRIGIGNYWRNSHEILLTAIRGEAKRFADHSLQSWLKCDRGRHSAKPEHVRHYIERASPAPRLELFGRRSAIGWTVFGNEVEHDLLSLGSVSFEAEVYG